MKKTYASVITIIILTASNAFAGGGIYGNGIGLKGGGGGYYRYNSYGSSYPSDYLYGYGGGIILDSAVAKDKIFNYRFKAGYDRYYASITSSSSKFDPTNRYSMSQTFGFGIVRNEDTRFWIGPQIGFHYFRFKEKRPLSTSDDEYYLLLSQLLINPSLLSTNFIPFYLYMDKKKITKKHDYIGLNLLLAMGINVNLGDNATIFIDFGIGYMGNYSVSGGDNPLQPHNIGIQASTGVMFRVDDRYRKQDVIKAQVQEASDQQ
jgi:hypothetical protein